MNTTKEEIITILERRPEARPTDIKKALYDDGRELSPDQVVTLIKDISQAVEGLQVAPPQCRDCGFDEFDKPANIPSQCPDCRSEWIEEPVFRKVSP